MPTNREPRPALRFGRFEVDFQRGDLRKDGQRTKLQGQPFQVLAMLLRQPGEVVTREELHAHIWPQDTFVDFDTGLYTAVKKLRLALNDSADQPRFIETIPRRGYRFRIEVEPVTEVNGSMNGKGGLPDASDAAPARSKPSRLLIGAAVSATCVILFAVCWATFRPLRREPPSAGWNMNRITSVGNCYDAVISPNGQFVAYVRDDSGGQSLWLRQIATRSDSLLIPSAGARYWGMTFSPDGEYIYYVASQDSTGAGKQDASLYRIPFIGGPGVKLKEHLDSPISFSPDGTQYVFVREYTSQHESALMVASLTGDSERKLASSELPDYMDFPSWSPDGKTIACTGVSLRRPSRIMFYRADGAGEKQQPISSSDWGHIRKIEWTKNGTGLLMAVYNRQSTGYQLWRLSYPQGELRGVTNDLNSYVRLSATANSHTLVTIQETASASIWLAPNGDTASARQLTPDSGNYSGLSWTADGRILYAADTLGSSNIWIMDSDGKNRKQLTQGNLFRHHPAASPDGQYFFFASCQNNDCDIWRMNGDGTHLKQLTNGSHVGDLQCTPDGKWIVYTSPGADQWATLWRISVDGGNAVELSKNRILLAAVSPNGKWIASFSLADQADTQTGQPTLEIIPFDGGPPLRTFKVSTTVNYLAGLQWIRHGGAVTYVDNQGAFSNVWSQPMDGGAPTQLTDFKGDKLFEFAWSHDGSHLVYLRGIDMSDVVLMTDFE